MDWSNVSLGDILNFRRGHDLPKTQMNDGGIPVVGSNGIIGYHDEYTTESPCVTIGRSGNVGNPHIEYQKCWAHNTTLYIDDFKGNDEIFIYYFLLTLDLDNYRGGSAVPTLNRNHIHPIEVRIPPLPTQHKIAAILSALDDKIENNRKTAEKLEEIAAAVFRRWFVDFEFSDAQGKPYKSSGGKMVESELGLIPEGWEVTSFCDIAEVKSGYSYKGSELMQSIDAMVTIKNFDRNGGFKLDGLKEIEISERVKKSHFVSLNDIIVAHTDLTQKADIIGNPIMICSKGQYRNLIFSMDTVKVVPKTNKFSQAFVYYLLKSQQFKNHALGYVSGTTVLHLSKKALPEYKVALPKNIEIIKLLGEILLVSQKTIVNFINENAVLQQTRDAPAAQAD